MKEKSYTNVFNDMGIYWAEIADQNSTQRQLTFIKKLLNPQWLILDLACGTGRHLIPLAQKGYNIVGLDISTKLLKIAKARLSGIQVVQADMRLLPFKPHMFDSAVSMDTSFGYLPSTKDDLQSLRELKEALKKNGVFTIDIFNRQQLNLKYKTNWHQKLRFSALGVLLKSNSRLTRWILFNFFNWKKYTRFSLLQIRQITKDGNELHDLWIICEKSEGRIKIFQHTARLYELCQLQELLKQASFVFDRIYGDYEEQQFSSDSKRLILIANAK